MSAGLSPASFLDLDVRDRQTYTHSCVCMSVAHLMGAGIQVGGKEGRRGRAVGGRCIYILGNTRLCLLCFDIDSDV